MAAPTNETLIPGLAGPEGRENPYPLYDQARAQGPVVWVEYLQRSLAAVGHAACLEALQSHHVNSSSSPFEAIVPENERAGLERFFDLPHHQVLWSNPPDHTRLRVLLQKAFTPRMVRKRTEAISRMVDDFLDDMAAADQADVMDHVARQLPSSVIAEVLGIPPEDRARFKPLADGVALRYSKFDRQSIIDGGPAFDQLVDYIEELIEQRRKAPDDGLLSALVHVSESGDTLTHEELVANTHQLLVAGHETTTNLIGNGTLALLANRDQWDLLVGDPSQAPRAVEELLRFDAPFQFTGRVAREDMTLAAEPVASGTTVLVVLGSGNHDPEVFHEPHRLDITRDPNPILSFGEGIHYCLGNQLARLEGRLYFSKLAERFPDLDLDPGREIVRNPSPVLRGLRHLPVTLTA